MSAIVQTDRLLNSEGFDVHCESSWFLGYIMSVHFIINLRQTWTILYLCNDINLVNGSLTSDQMKCLSDQCTVHNDVSNIMWRREPISTCSQTFEGRRQVFQ